jgi:Zn-dependent oligopeptidase
MDMGGYVQQLNTHYGIYTALVRALKQQEAEAASDAAAAATGAAGAAAAAAPAASAGGEFSAEALLVGRMLRRDFERYGVHLSGERRDGMTALVQRGQVLGMRFTQGVVDPGQLGSLELRGPLAGAPAFCLPAGKRPCSLILLEGPALGVRLACCLHLIWALKLINFP